MNLSKRKNLLLIAVCGLFAFNAMAQSSEELSVHYKVTAVSNDSTELISESNIVEVHPPIHLFIPNAFTPNGDGLNDEFYAKGHGVEEFSMAVYNRWGELIFETADMNNPWSGYYQGALAQSGVYVYDITAKSHQGERVNKTGSVTLIYN